MPLVTATMLKHSASDEPHVASPPIDRLRLLVSGVSQRFVNLRCTLLLPLVGDVDERLIERETLLPANIDENRIYDIGGEELNKFQEAQEPNNSRAIRRRRGSAALARPARADHQRLVAKFELALRFLHAYCRPGHRRASGDPNTKETGATPWRAGVRMADWGAAIRGIIFASNLAKPRDPSRKRLPN